MSNSLEIAAAAAFDKQSRDFDDQYAANSIIQYKRQRVRAVVLDCLKPGSRILELNAGTGDDAIFFAALGHTIHATDISTGMQDQLHQKVSNSGLNSITQEICSYTSLDTLHDKGPYDLIFSNFAGLNCTNDLEAVFKPFDSLLKPGGHIVMVMLPRFCLWETLLIFKGKFRTATRRFFSAKGRKAHINGSFFKCWYHSPQRVKKLLSPRFKFLKQEGLCTLVPPSYIENFAEKYPKLFSFLSKMENKWKGRWPWKHVGDYYIISFQKS